MLQDVSIIAQLFTAGKLRTKKKRPRQISYPDPNNNNDFLTLRCRWKIAVLKLCNLENQNSDQKNLNSRYLKKRNVCFK